MKLSYTVLFPLLLIAFNSYSQDSYQMYGPDVEASLKPKAGLPEFTYDSQLMSSFIYKRETYEDDKLQSTETINRLTRDVQELDYFPVIDVQKSNSTSSDKASMAIKKSDTVAYTPKNDEIIFNHSLSQELFPTPTRTELLEELVFVNKGKIIAIQDMNMFKKYSYDANENITEIVSYQTILELNERSENPVPVFIMSPLFYVKISYDSSNRMTDKWIYSNQELYFENENSEYNEALIVHHEKYKYNDRDLLDQSTLSTFFIKSFQENDPAAKEYDKLTNDVDTIDFNKLLKFLHSKDVYLKSYTYNTGNQITKKSVNKEQWRFRNNELIKTNSLEVSNISIAQNDNKITVDEEIVIDNNTSDKQRYRTIFVTDQNSYLTEKTTYSNKTKKGELTLETKETMSITYK